VTPLDPSTHAIPRAPPQGDLARGFPIVMRNEAGPASTVAFRSSFTAVQVVAFFLRASRGRSRDVSARYALSRWRPAGGERAVLRPSRKARLPLSGDVLASALSNCSGGAVSSLGWGGGPSSTSCRKAGAGDSIRRSSRLSKMPTALDNGQRSPRKLLRAVVRRLTAALGSN
jgi:hypothetical protein